MGDISIVSILTRMLATATPLAIMGVGGLFGERAGIVNIGLDGNLLIGAFSAAYWLVVTAFLLCVQQGVFAIRLERTWLIWAVAGILYAAVLEIVRAIVNRKQ